jgi:hypothetical protein
VVRIGRMISVNKMLMVKISGYGLARNIYHCFPVK